MSMFSNVLKFEVYLDPKAGVLVQVVKNYLGREPEYTYYYGDNVKDCYRSSFHPDTIGMIFIGDY